MLLSRSKSKQLIRFTLLAIVGVITISAISFARPAHVCGLNVRSGVAVDEWDYQGYKVRALAFSLPEQNFMVQLSRWTDWPMQQPCQSRQIPSGWRIRGANNAYATDLFGISNGRCKSPVICIDEPWIDGLVAKTGNPWVRKTIVAHEMGHIRFGHPYGEGAPTVWQREYDADKFAGYSMCKAGATLRQAQEVFYHISAEGPDYDDSHPSLASRLRAIAEGFEEASCESGIEQESGTSGAIELEYASAYTHGISISVEGTRYDLSRARTYTIDIGESSEIAIWECPSGNCRWTKFSVRAGERYRIVDSGNGGLTLVRR